MGKKSRVKTQKSGTGATASVSPKETLNLTSELLQSKSAPGLPAFLWARAFPLLHPQCCLQSHRAVTWASHSASLTHGLLTCKVEPLLQIGTM